MKTIKYTCIASNEKEAEYICKKDVIKLIDELDDLRTIEQFRLELKSRIEG